MEHTIIYRLVDPETGETRYIGQTLQTLKARMSNHLSCKRVNHLTCWIKSLKAKGLRPKIEEIVRVPDGEADTVEKLLITYFRSVGYRLVNQEGGGKGSNRRSSEETKRKISKALAGKSRPPITEEHRENLSLSHQGKPNGFEGKRHTEESRAKMSLAKEGKPGNWTGKTHTPESRAKMSENSPMKRPEVRARASEAQRGRPWSEARRAAQNRRKGNYETTT